MRVEHGCQFHFWRYWGKVAGKAVAKQTAYFAAGCGVATMCMVCLCTTILLTPCTVQKSGSNAQPELVSGWHLVSHQQVSAKDATADQTQQRQACSHRS